MKRKFRILDLCCRAGGCSKGYHDAGLEVVGVDIEPQKDYAFEFHQADAFDYARCHWKEFDAIHASPHCQGYIKRGKHMRRKDGQDMPQQIHLFREMLLEFGRPYIIENVTAAPIADLPLFETYAITLCGTMFGLKTDDGAELQRHRLFETNWYCHLPMKCKHGEDSVIGVYGGHARDRRRRTITVTGSTPQQNVERNQIRETFSIEDAKTAMGIDWMTMRDLSQAIPPAYTQFIGEQLLKSVLLPLQKS